MKVLRVFPFFAVTLAAYVGLMLWGVDFDTGANPLFQVTLLSGGVWQATAGDLFLMAVIVVLYFEILKATTYDSQTVMEHVASTIVFIVHLVLFLYVEAAGNRTFLILTLLSLLDVVGGFTITIRAAARDVAVRSGA